MQLTKKILLSLILLSYSLLGLAQQSLNYKAILDTNRILIGDHVALRILVSQSPQIKVGFPTFHDSLVSGLEVLGDGPIDTLKKTPDELSLVKSYMLTSFDSGSYTIPNIQLLVQVKDAKPDTVTLNKLLLHVAAVAVDTTKGDIKDIKPPISAPITFSEVAPWLFGGLGILAVVGLIVWLIIRKLQNKPILSQIKPDEPADVMAIRMLIELKEKNLWQNGHYKQFHSELTEILRLYLYRRFGINALEQTSDEILQAIVMQKTISANLLTQLRTIFTVADLTKFAKYVPAPDENETSLKLSEQFIDNTKPIPVDAKLDSEKDVSKDNTNASTQNSSN